MDWKILCHYQLGHSAAVNISDVDRIAIYFRVWLRDIEEHRWSRLTNIWESWRIGVAAARSSPL